MILCVQMEKLGAHLSTLGLVMDKYQSGDPKFPDQALKWLQEAEQTMSALRLPDGAEMSALRGRVIRATDTVQKDSDRPARAAIRNARNVAAAEALERAEQVLRGRLLAAEERLKLFEEKLCEGITAFILQTPLPEKRVPHMEWLSQVWSQLREQESTRALTIYFSASLSAVDRIFLLDRVLSRASEQGLAVAPIENTDRRANLS